MAYCIAVAHLMKQPGCAEAAIRASECWVNHAADPIVRDWLLLSRDYNYDPNINENAGSAKWAFIYAFRQVEVLAVML